MTKVDTKSNQMYKCNVCDKPYVKKGALTNHLRKVHNLTMSPSKKQFMDTSCSSDLENDLDKENSVLLDNAKDLDEKDAADELEIMLGMKSTVTFDTSVLTRANTTKKTDKFITTLSSSDKENTGQPLNNVPLCPPAAKFLSESQKKILIPDIEESEDEDVKVKETISKINPCDKCNQTFTNVKKYSRHIKYYHAEDHNSAGDHKCQECSYRTNFAANYLHHLLNTHSDKEFARTVKSLKPVDSAVIYMLAEQNMALAAESKLMRKDLNYIKKALEPKSKAAKFNCQKCKDVCASPTRMQEHMLADHCCKYCDKVFASKTKKERHKKYMCQECRLTFSHSVELNIHNRTFHKEDINTPQVLQYQCTECSHGEHKEEDIIKHIEAKHTTILSPAKITKPTPAPRNNKPSLSTHVSEEHINRCNKCLKVFVNRTDLKNHVTIIHKAAKEASSAPPTKQFDCPICSLSNNSQAEVIKHIEHKHTEKCSVCQTEFTCKSELESHISSAHKNTTSSNSNTCRICTHQFRSENEMKTHIINVHERKISDIHLKCDKCNKKFKSENELNTHIGEIHISQARVKNTLLVADSHSKLQNPRLIEQKALKGIGLFAPSFMQPRSGRAYCSSPDWPNSRFPENNLKDKVTELLSYREHSQLIFGAPGNDISNIDRIETQAEKYRLAVKSSENCIAIAEQALRSFPKLEKVRD